MTTGIVDRIVEQNLGVYRAAPSRLQEDVSQEAQVASDYRGRLVYELLQNADDAMEGHATTRDRVAFLITDDALWMANSGRSLTDADIQGLCGLGASSKVDAAGTTRTPRRPRRRSPWRSRSGCPTWAPTARCCASPTMRMTRWS